jgi:hypothetical protein
MTATRFPTFLTIEQASEYTGLSKDEITADLNAIDPLPHRKKGRYWHILRDGIDPYYAGKYGARCA